MFAKESLYKLLDLITFRKGIPVKVNNFKIRLPARYHRYFSKTYEEENFNFFLKHYKKGTIILDIGAHFGLFSVFFQKIAHGIVYAFEPTKTTNDILRQTVALNHCEDTVKVLAMAVDEIQGTADFFLSEVVGGRANTLVKNSKLSHAKQSYKVEVTSVDHFAGSRNLAVDCMKIDAEGAELGVLKGADSTIKKFKPIILLSLHPEPIQSRGDSLKEIWDLIVNHGYTILLSDTGQKMDENSFCNTTELFDVHLIPVDR